MRASGSHRNCPASLTTPLGVHRFLDMIESYFEQPDDVKMADTRPEEQYVVTPLVCAVGSRISFCCASTATKWVPRLPTSSFLATTAPSTWLSCGGMCVCMCAVDSHALVCRSCRTAKLGEDEKALSLCPPERDPKWRYFWRIGDRPDPSVRIPAYNQGCVSVHGRPGPDYWLCTALQETAYPDLNAENVEPAAFPEWAKTMNAWGEVLLNAGKDVATLAAHGFGMEDDALASRMELGPHLLAPTATNLAKHDTVGDVLAGYHYDLNFMTVHGKSRFPGLYVWTRAGVKMPVKVPDGCLLIQVRTELMHDCVPCCSHLGHVCMVFRLVHSCSTSLVAMCWPASTRLSWALEPSRRWSGAWFSRRGQLPTTTGTSRVLLCAVRCDTAGPRHLAGRSGVCHPRCSHRFVLTKF